jgi:hypothetical protein
LLLRLRSLGCKIPRSKKMALSIDRATAMRIFDGVYSYAVTGAGEVNALQGRRAGKLRLRLGDYRVFFMRLTRFSFQNR